MGEEPSLSNDSDLPSELTIDHGRGFGAMLGPVGLGFDFPESESSEKKIIVEEEIVLLKASYYSLAYCPIGRSYFNKDYYLISYSTYKT